MEAVTTPIYLDSAAATPLDERIFAVMQPFLFTDFYNPSSAYMAARKVRAAYEEARHSLAQQLGAKANDIILTAGATESTNLAIHGIMQQFPEANIVFANIEHQAVREAARQYDHTIISVETTGRITPEALRSAINESTVLVSVGYVNSELGTQQPLRKLAAVIDEIRAERKKNGIALPLYLHTDASQAAGFADVHVARLGVDLLTLSASKIHGPKQVGLLYVKSGIELQPLLHGGGQESGLRSGTENVAGVVGFAKALELSLNEKNQRQAAIKKMRDQFESTLRQSVDDIQFNGDLRSRAPHISHFSIPGVDAETLLFMLDERGVIVSTGAACAANKGTASHVLRAIGLIDAEVQGSIRASFDWMLDDEQVRQAALLICESVKKLREMSA